MHEVERKVEAVMRQSDELWEQRQHQEAVRCAQEALLLARTKLGVDHPATAAAMNNVGSMVQALGDLPGALPYFEEALATNLRVLGPEHESIPRGLNTLYTSISDLKNPAQALPHWDRMIQILRSCEELSSTPLLIVRLAETLVERGVTVAAVEPGNEKELPREQGDRPWRTVRAEQAAAAYDEAVDWARRLPEADPRTADAVMQLGHRFMRIGWLDRARTCFGMALDCSRKASGEHTEVVATCLHSLASVLRNMQRPAEALPLEEQALQIRRRLLGQSHPETRTSLYWLARCHRLVENHIRAEELYREAIETFRQIDTVDAARDATTVKQLAETTSELAEVYELLGDFGLAAARFEEAVAVLRKAGLERSISFVDAIEGLARVERKRGHYAAAEPLLCQAAAAREQLVDQLLSQFGDTFYLIPGQGSSHPKLIPTTIVGAEGLRLNELYDEMRRCVSCLNELALLYWSMGDPRRAEPPLRKAVGFFRDIHEIPPLNPSLAAPELREPRPNLDVNDPAYCDVIATLARLYVALERPDTACLLLDNALWDFRTAELPPEMLRHVKHGLSRDPEVMERLDDTTRRSGRWKTHYSALQIALARASQAKGEYADARKMLESARDLRAQAVGEEHPDHVAALVELAQLLLSLGEYGEAEPLLHRALAVYEKALGDKHPETAACRSHLARVCGASGRLAEAFALARHGVETQDHLIGQVFSISSDSQRATFLETLRDDLDRFLTLLLELTHPQATKAAGLPLDASGAYAGREESADEHMAGSSDGAVRVGFDLVLRRKALLAEALATQRDASLAARYSQLRAPLRELALLRMQIARATLLGPGNEGSKEHQQVLSQWQARREILEAELARQIPEMNLEQRLRAADCRAVALALPAGVALVEFVRFRVFDFYAVPARGQRRWKGTRYLAFVLTAWDPVHLELIDLGEAEPIDRMIRAYRAAITGRVEGGRDLGEAPATRNRQAGSDPGPALRGAVFDKLSRALRGSTRLLLAPDGDLARLPFEVLPTDDGRRLIDSHHISYIATGRDALRLGANPSGQPAEPLVIADPDFDLETGVIRAQQDSTRDAGPSASPRKPGFWSRWSGLSSPTPVPGKSERASPPKPVPPASMPQSSRHSRDLDRNHLRFARLPGTRVEGERIATLLGVEAWLEARSLESHLKACRSPRILHVATHGFFLNDQKRDESSELSDWRVLGSRYGSDPGLENPLLRSGLALAGVNCWLAGGTPPAEAEDGLLTAEDVCGLDLLDTDLVVLSACETGLGEIQVGEGVFGLRRAFVLAGAKTLVMSLWKVPDQQTQELMEDFYRRLLAGQRRADALRAAQLALKARCPEPLYWGAFICQGDPGPLVHQSRSQPPDETG